MAQAEANITGRNEASLPSGPGEKLSLTGGLLALGLLVLSLFWMLQAGIISHGAQVAEAVPAVPAVGGLLVLTVVGLALRR